MAKGTGKGPLGRPLAVPRKLAAPRRAKPRTVDDERRRSSEVTRKTTRPRRKPGPLNVTTVQTPVFNKDGERTGGKQQRVDFKTPGKLTAHRKRVVKHDRERDVVRKQKPKASDREVAQVARRRVVQQDRQLERDVKAAEGRSTQSALEQLADDLGRNKVKAPAREPKTVGGLAKNLARNAKDVIVGIPSSGFVIGKAAGEEVGNRLGTNRKKRPGLKPLKEGVQRDDPAYAAGEAIVKAVKGDSKGAKKALRRAGDNAYKRPLDVVGYAAGAGAAAGRGATAAKHAGKGGTQAARARPPLRVEDDPKPATKQDVKAQRETARAEVRARQQGQKPKPRAKARIEREQQYSPNAATRTVQKARENRKVRKGQDPFVAAGRKDRKLRTRRVDETVRNTKAATLEREAKAEKAARRERRTLGRDDAKRTAAQLLVNRRVEPGQEAKHLAALKGTATSRGAHVNVDALSKVTPAVLKDPKVVKVAAAKEKRLKASERRLEREGFFEGRDGKGTNPQAVAAMQPRLARGEIVQVEKGDRLPGGPDKPKPPPKPAGPKGPPPKGTRSKGEMGEVAGGGTGFVSGGGQNPSAAAKRSQKPSAPVKRSQKVAAPASVDELAAVSTRLKEVDAEIRLRETAAREKARFGFPKKGDKVVGRGRKRAVFNEDEEFSALKDRPARGGRGLEGLRNERTDLAKRAEQLHAAARLEEAKARPPAAKGEPVSPGRGAKPRKMTQQQRDTVHQREVTERAMLTPERRAARVEAALAAGIEPDPRDVAGLPGPKAPSSTPQQPKPKVKVDPKRQEKVAKKVEKRASQEGVKPKQLSDARAAKDKQLREQIETGLAANAELLTYLERARVRALKNNNKTDELDERIGAVKAQMAAGERALEVGPLIDAAGGPEVFGKPKPSNEFDRARERYEQGREEMGEGQKKMQEGGYLLIEGGGKDAVRKGKEGQAQMEVGLEKMLAEQQVWGDLSVHKNLDDKVRQTGREVRRLEAKLHESRTSSERRMTDSQRRHTEARLLQAREQHERFREAQREQRQASLKGLLAQEVYRRLKADPRLKAPEGFDMAKAERSFGGKLQAELAQQMKPPKQRNIEIEPSAAKPADSNNTAVASAPPAANKTAGRATRKGYVWTTGPKRGQYVTEVDLDGEQGAFIRGLERDTVHTEELQQPRAGRGYTAEDAILGNLKDDRVLATELDRERQIGLIRLTRALEQDHAWQGKRFSHERAAEVAARRPGWTTLNVSKTEAIVVRREIAARWKQQINEPSKLERSGRYVTRQFIRTVLPFSATWQVGNAVDQWTRLVVADARFAVPGLAGKSGRDLVKATQDAMRELDPHLADELTATLKGHFGARATVKPLKASDITHDSKREMVQRAGEAASAFRDKPIVHPLAQAGRKTTDAVFSAGVKAESAVVRRSAGVALEQYAKALGHDVNDHARLGEKLAAEFKDDPSKLLEFQRRTLEITGDYVTRGPGTKWAQHVAVPFIQWIKAANKFTFHTLPTKHPYKVALAMWAAAITEEERAQLGLSAYITKAEAKERGLPHPKEGYLAGAVPLPGGKSVPTAPLTSLGEAARILEGVEGLVTGKTQDGITKLTEPIAPFVQRPALIAKDHGAEVALPRATEAFIPGVKQTRRALEGERSHPRSTVLKPIGTGGKSTTDRVLAAATAPSGRGFPDAPAKAGSSDRIRKVPVGVRFPYEITGPNGKKRTIWLIRER